MQNVAHSPVDSNDWAEDRGTVLLHRFRAAIWAFLLATTVIGLAQLLFGRPTSPLVHAVRCGAVASYALLLVLLYRRPDQHTAQIAGWCGLLVACATTTSIGIHFGDTAPGGLIAVALAISSATLIPWPPGSQFVAALIIAGSYAIEVAAVHGGLSFISRRESAVVAAVGAASVFVTQQVNRQRHALERERRQRSDELARQRSLLREVVDTIPHFVFVKDRDGRFTLVNRAIAEAYGTTTDDLIGKTDADFNKNPEEVEWFLRHDREVMDRLEERVIDEEVITDATGKQRWLKTIKRPLLPSGGRADQVLGISTDITEQRSYAERLREAATVSNRLAAFGRGVLGLAHAADLTTQLCKLTVDTVECDRAIAWMPDVSNQHLIPQAEAGFSDEDWQKFEGARIPLEAIAQQRQMLSDAGDVRLFDLSWAKGFLNDDITDDQPAETKILLIGLRWKGVLTGALTASFRTDPEAPHRHQIQIARGISQLASLAFENARLLDELTTASEMKSEFVATMSHELRTPLNVIVGYTQLLGEGEMGEITTEQKETLDRLHANALTLLDLVNATLDLNRLEAGKISIQIEDVDLQLFLGEIDMQMRQSRVRSGVRFEWQMADEVRHLRTDPHKLKTILGNLTSNALKFTERGSVTLSVTPQGESVAFQLRDTGVGIAPEARNLIFEPFRQANASISAELGGVGLGLHIVHRLVSLLGGTIDLESEVGEGSTFTVLLPRGAAER